ncbi:MAG: protein kinase [Sandaracinaceae bacterium]
MPILTSNERLGTEIAGKYRLDRILGRGGMGVVFAGVHRWTDRRVAVKLLNPEHVQNRDTVRRFLRAAATKLEHRNVVDVLDMGRDEDETVYLVLELLEGYSLAELLAAVGARFPPSLALDVLRPMMDAPFRARARARHRPPRPQAGQHHVSRDGDGMMVPKLLDFGIAKIAETEGSAATHTGALVGTPRYMSPEQVDASVDVGPAADAGRSGSCSSSASPAGRPSSNRRRRRSSSRS